MVASIVLHIVILAFLLFAGEYESSTPPRLSKLDSNLCSCRTITAWCFGKNSQRTKREDHDKTSNTKEISKSQKKKKKSTPKKQVRFQIPKRKKNQTRNLKRNKKKKEPEKKEEPKKEVKEPEKSLHEKNYYDNFSRPMLIKWS